MNRKQAFKIGVVVLILCLSAMALSLQGAAIWTVCPSGCDFSSIQGAIDEDSKGNWMNLATVATTLPASNPVVRLVYLVPSDKELNENYRIAIENSAKHLQIWYRNQMGNGKTFRLHTPVVETFRTPHTSRWYVVHRTGSDRRSWFWDNVLADGFALTRGRFNDPRNIWVFYIDAELACGQIIGGTSGVVVLPAHDLWGLSGQNPVYYPCPSDPPDTAGPCRFVGGLGHELGHAFGLPHPPGCEDQDPGTWCPERALMWLGYRSYPNAYLLPEDKAILNRSHFFATMDLTTALFDCSNLVHRRD